MEDTYSIKDIIEEFRRDTKESLDRIERQTTKTNGRVNSLENHRAYLWGAYTLLVLLGGTIVYLSVSAIDNKIANGIREALEVKGVQIQSK
jgi:hypothetical protein